MPYAEKQSQHLCVRQFKLLRKQKGMKQIDVAELTGISVESISSYERGKISPSLNTFTKLIHAVGGKNLEITGWD